MLVSKTLSARRSTGSRTVITGVSITFSDAGLFSTQGMTGERA